MSEVHSGCMQNHPHWIVDTLKDAQCPAAPEAWVLRCQQQRDDTWRSADRHAPNRAQHYAGRVIDTNAALPTDHCGRDFANQAWMAMSGMAGMSRITQFT